MRIARTTDPLRRKRSELLCHLPDGRPAARGPILIAAPEAGLATLAGGMGGTRRARLDSGMLFVLANYDSFTSNLVKLFGKLAPEPAAYRTAPPPVGRA